MEVKMQIKNAEGVMIDTPVPENLVSTYEALGWKKVEEKEQAKEEIKEEIKEETKASQKSLNK